MNNKASGPDSVNSGIETWRLMFGPIILWDSLKTSLNREGFRPNLYYI